MAANTDKLKKYKSLFSTTLSVGIGTGTSDTITPSTVVGLPTDTAITLTFDRVDSGGTATPTKLERITGVISGGNLTSYVRAKDSTTEQAHSGGAVIEMVWNAQDWNDMVTWGLVGHNQDGSHGASSIVASNLSASSVTSGRIGASAVVAGNIAASAVIAGDLAASAVQSGNLAASSVLAGNLAASSVQSGNIAASAIVLGNLAASSVQSGNLNFSPAGKIVQVVNAAYSTAETNTTQNYADTGLTATITPTSASNSILVMVSQNGLYKGTGGNYGISIQLLRGAGAIALIGDALFYGVEGAGGTGECYLGAVSICYLDSPATTSATTYKTQFKAYGTPLTVKVQNLSAVSTITLMEIAA